MEIWFSQVMIFVGRKCAGETSSKYSEHAQHCESYPRFVKQWSAIVHSEQYARQGYTAIEPLTSQLCVCIGSLQAGEQRRAFFVLNHC